MTLKFLEKYDYVSKPGFQRCLSPRPSMSINITTCSFLTPSYKKEKGKKCIQFQTIQCTKISRKSTTKFKQESSVSSSSVEQPYIRSISLKFYCYICKKFFHTFAARCLARDIPYSPKYALSFTISSLLTEERSPVKNNKTKDLNAFDFVYVGQYKILTNCPYTRCKTMHFI